MFKGRSVKVWVIGDTFERVRLCASLASELAFRLECPLAPCADAATTRGVCLPMVGRGIHRRLEEGRQHSAGQ